MPSSAHLRHVLKKINNRLFGIKSEKRCQSYRPGQNKNLEIGDLLFHMDPDRKRLSGHYNKKYTDFMSNKSGTVCDPDPTGSGPKTFA